MNKFRSATKVPSRQAKPSSSFLFRQEVVVTKQPMRKLIIRSRKHLRSMLLSGRDAYLRRGQTTRSTLVMNLIQSLVSHLKADTITMTTISTHDDQAIRARNILDGVCSDSLEVAAKLSENDYKFDQ